MGWRCGRIDESVKKRNILCRVGEMAAVVGCLAPQILFLKKRSRELLAEARIDNIKIAKENHARAEKTMVFQWQAPTEFVTVNKEKKMK